MTTAPTAVGTTPDRQLDAAIQVLQRLNVRVMGQGDRTLVFCNGFNCGQTMWKYVAPALAKHYHLVFFDQAGVSKADPAAVHCGRYQSFDGFAQDVLDICQALELEQVVLVGHSAGALVAMLAAIRAPDLVRETILLAASPRYLNDLGYYGGFEAADMYHLLAELRTNYLGWAGTFATMMIGQFDAPELSHELVDCASNADPEMARRIVRWVFMGDFRAYVPLLRQPTLLVQCADDPAAPEEVSQYWLTHLPQATLRVLPTAGHCPHLTMPGETVGVVLEFLGEGGGS